MGNAKSEAEVLTHMGLCFKSGSTGCNPYSTWVQEKVRALEAVEKALGTDRLHSVLDLGIGDMKVMEMWSSFGSIRYTGVDGCGAVLAEAAARYSGGLKEFVLAPFSALITSDTTQPQASLHDMVTALDILYHIQDEDLHGDLLRWIFKARKAVVLTYALEVRDYGGKRPGQGGFAWFPRPRVGNFIKDQDGWEVVYQADSQEGPPQRLVALVRSFLGYNGWHG